MPPATTTDDWVVRLRADDSKTRDAALSELRDLLVRGLSRSLTGRYSGGVSAEDVAQEALLKITASLDQFQGKSRFTTWAMTIATRIGISQLRRRHFRDKSLDAMRDSDGPSLDPPAPKETDGPERRELLATLGRLIEEELTEKQRLATRALLEGMPVEEIATRMGSNRNAVYKLVHDARTRLRDGFARAGIDAPTALSALT